VELFQLKEADSFFQFIVGDSHIYYYFTSLYSCIMGKISLIIGIIIGIIFSVAFPEVAQTINDAIMPTIQSISEKMINWITA